MEKEISRLFIIMFLITISTVTVTGSFFSSMSDMKKLLQIESDLINQLKQFVVNEKENINLLKEFSHPDHAFSPKGIASYFENPINVLLIMKRLTVNLQKMENLINRSIDEELSGYLKDLLFPTDADLNGAATALKRLQKTYKLNANDFEVGKLKAIGVNAEMSVSDCYTLATELYSNSDYLYSTVWLKEALKKVNSKDKLMQVKVFRALIKSYMEYDFDSALSTTKLLLEIVPNDSENLRLQAFLEKQIGTKPKSFIQLFRNEIFNKTTKPNHLISNGRDESANNVYESLCRNEWHKRDYRGKIASQLHCKYAKNKSFFLLIAPLKLEELSIDPYIVRYHDVIYDNEIQHIKNVAKLNMKDARIKDDETGKSIRSYVRTSKVAFISDAIEEKLDIFQKRIEDMTGLSNLNAEKLQVVNYGIGGHYEPHIDFFEKQHIRRNVGNRIATLLMYMNDVIQGGATVFPFLNLSVKPKKGSAVLWFNLHKTGDGDYRTTHASCPVLIGKKWICNKWIREIGQEFLRPCDLTSDTISYENL